MKKIEKICVIGSGVMGSRIAAQIANSKTNVVLLDIAEPNSTNPNSIVLSALEKLKAQQPPALSYPDLVKYIKIGNLTNDLVLIKGCDLIIEVIVEKLEIKHKLYNSIIPMLKEDAILSSNTSTLQLTGLKEKLPKDIRSRFLITHFFNPPRYMELVELITDNETNQSAIDSVSSFISKLLGKTIIKCNDTPGFIANRVGCFLLEMTIRRAIKLNLNPVMIDQIFTKLLGFPSTGIFGLYDLIGHDVMSLISDSLRASLPKNDKYNEIYINSQLLDQMKKQGLLGRKSGSGFYKISAVDDGKKIKEVINFNNLTYNTAGNVKTPETITELLNSNNEYSKFFTELLSDFFLYIIRLIPTVTDNPANIDKAMKLGYSLKFGPFELLETYMPGGRLWLNDRIKDNIYNYQSTYLKPNSGLLDSVKEIASNDSSKLVLYKNNYVFTINSKMNSLNHNVFNLLIDSVKRLEDLNKNLYIWQGTAPFSAGADVKFLKNNIERKDFRAIENFLLLGQKAMMRLKYSPIIITSCPYGIALGGGCEILLHSDLVIAHQNLNAGLVELGIGLIPGWGGVKEMFLRSAGNIEILIQNLTNILIQNKSSSGDYFVHDYEIIHEINMNKDLILDQAFSANLPKKSKYPTSIILPKIDLFSAIDTSNYDELQKDVLAFFQKIVNKRNVTEETLLDLEREKFLELTAKPLCLAKLEGFT